MRDDTFKFKQFDIRHRDSAMKVGTDSILLGAWCQVLGTERQVLDIGSGCGILSLMIAQRLPKANITAVEIDRASYLESVENIKQSSWQERICVECADIRHVSFDKVFDFIICNPPFFKHLMPSNQARALARHQSQLPTQELLSQASQVLNDAGSYATIIPADQRDQYIQQARRFGLYPSQLTAVRHTAHLPIRRVLIQFSRIARSCQENILVIGQQGHRNPTYQQLVAPFYS
ncbi:MAG: methyltransferase [Saprospiraceae bacterium]|nr:methyltransferase [Saprospiraceae bacterium]